MLIANGYFWHNLNQDIYYNWSKEFLAYLKLHDILRDADVFIINSASRNAELLTFQGDKDKIAENPSEKNTSHQKKFEDGFLMQPDSHHWDFQKIASPM